MKSKDYLVCFVFSFSYIPILKPIAIPNDVNIAKKLRSRVPKTFSNFSNVVLIGWLELNNPTNIPNGKDIAPPIIEKIKIDLRPYMIPPKIALHSIPWNVIAKIFDTLEITGSSGLRPITENNATKP